VADVSNINSSGAWTYAAIASTVLRTTTLAMGQADGAIRFAEGPTLKPKHDAACTGKGAAGFDFSEADQVPAASSTGCCGRG